MSSINGFSSGITLPQFEASRTVNDTFKKAADHVDPGFNSGFGQRGVRSEIDASGLYKKAGYGAGELDSGFNAGFSRQRNWA